jgi:hypothetical protein
MLQVTKARSLVLAVALALVVGACSAAVQAGGGTGGGATISIASPAEGAEVSVPFDVQLESNVPLGTPDTGNHHAHLYFDTGTDAADYDIVYGTSWQVTRPLSPGKHTIIAALANPDHSLAGPTQTITVTVVGSGAGGPSGAPSAPTGPTY